MRTYPTIQEVFDGIWNHFVVNNNPRSVKPGKTLCLYAGTGCAIGCLIDDKNLCERMDGLGGVFDVFSEFGEDDGVRGQLIGIFPFAVSEDSIQLLHDLQTIHDSHNPNRHPVFNQYMDEELRRFAKINNLKIPA